MIFGKFFALFIGSKKENQLVEDIIQSWRDHGDKWYIDDHNAIFWPLRIWIANSPYADMEMDGRRLLQRDRLRYELNALKLRKAMGIINES